MAKKSLKEKQKKEKKYKTKKNKNKKNSSDTLIACYFSPNISSIFLHKEENTSSLNKRVSMTILPAL